MSTFAWGSTETKFFFEITPEKILDAVEALGFRCTGRVLTLNSMENRVYEVELELDETPKTPSEKFLIVKFYRPGRWSKAQIADEHQFLWDLKNAEIPAVAPLKDKNGDTIHQVPGIDIWYCLFPKVGGRAPDELAGERAEQIGRLLARIHAVGAAGKADTRIILSPENYGTENLKSLLDAGSIPKDLEARYRGLVEEIVKTIKPLFEKVPIQRIHGDCHLGNLVWGGEGPFFVDFDDMVRGPIIQDFWLLASGRDDDALRARDRLITGYEEFRSFDDRQLKLIEPLRALRFIHFSAWIAKRWKDPAFTRAFPQFGSARYWEEQVADLGDQLVLINDQGSGGTGFNGNSGNS